MNLNQAPVGEHFVVKQLSVPADSPDWQSWLEEIGFLPGEHVQVRRRSLLSKGAVVVRIGHSTFALHSDEAECVLVDELPSTSIPPLANAQEGSE